MFCIMLLKVIYFGSLAKIVDVKTAFLDGELKEEIFMEFPQGMLNINKNDCHSK